MTLDDYWPLVAPVLPAVTGVFLVVVGASPSFGTAALTGRVRWPVAVLLLMSLPAALTPLMVTKPWPGFEYAVSDWVIMSTGPLLTLLLLFALLLPLRTHLEASNTFSGSPMALAMRRVGVGLLGVAVLVGVLGWVFRTSWPEYVSWVLKR